MKNKLVVILGPTATGKTSLALDLCQKFGGEIVSVDSRQAYTGMEIGTGKFQDQKSLPAQAGKIKDGELPVVAHLYDLANPDEQLNAHDCSARAWEAINSIWSRERTPFLVGGTGFYLNVILGGVSLAAGSVDRDLRKELESLSLDQLVERLKKVAPEKLKTVDLHNKYRLIRAIEIATGCPQGHPLPSARGGLVKKIVVGLTADNYYLYQRADERVDRMMASGLVDEVQGLVEKYGWEAPGLKTLGYQEFKPYFEGTIQLNETVQKIKFHTHAYIRRQKTYLRKYFKAAHWVDVSRMGFEKEVEKEVESFL